MTKIAITGPESCGKTTLTMALSEFYKVPYRSDESRLYFDGSDIQYKFEDLEKIAHQQWEKEQLLISHKPVKLFVDTEMTTLKIWSQYRFSKVCDFILEKQAEQDYDLILLCYPDLEWQFDPLRENKNDREVLYKTYLKEFERLNFNFRVVQGIGEARFTLAQYLVNKLSN